MKRRVIIHIGMHKTGSTSIQNTLYQSLSGPTFEYADFRDPNHSIEVFSLFALRPEAYYVHRAKGWDKEKISQFNEATMERIVRQFNTSDASTIIISGEDICFLQVDGLLKFKAFLSGYFDEIMVVGYVRPPHAFMESEFQERVKGQLNQLNVRSLYPGYRGRFEKFDLVFGKENVNLWLFDPNNFTSKNVVMDFCQRLSIKVPQGQIQSANESISREALCLLFSYRKFERYYDTDSAKLASNSQLIDALRTLGDSKLRFSREFSRQTLEENRNDIEWVENRLSGSLKESSRDFSEGVSSEENLLKVDSTVIAKLKMLVGEKYLPAEIEGSSVREVALLVHALRMRLAKTIEPDQGVKMHLEHLHRSTVGMQMANGDREKPFHPYMIESLLRQERPKLLENLNEKTGVDLIRNAFICLRDHIDLIESGVVKVNGLGEFCITKVPCETEGKPSVRRQIIFNLQ